jgi:hypothetical protein
MENSLFTDSYDPGFLVTQGFGQSATNPKPPVFYESLGIVQDLSVYQSLYVTKSVTAGVSVNVGNSRLTSTNVLVDVPARITNDVDVEKNLNVGNIAETKRLIVNGVEFRPVEIQARNGTFTVLAAV